MTYGFWRVGKGIREHNELAREKMWSRIYLIPMLTAEEDRDLVRRHLADQAREEKLLGTRTSPYNSDRYVEFLLYFNLKLLLVERNLVFIRNND